MTSRDLDGLSRLFAGEVTDLLNGTVVDGVRFSAIDRGTSRSHIAPGISPNALTPAFVPLRIGRRKPTGYLLVAFTTQLDEENRYLTVSKSQFAVCLEPDRKSMVVHYDYSLEPGNPYPDAHVQVVGSSRTLSQWCEASGCQPKMLERLHLPVGGRRFRPTLEDVIEFLVVEDLARPRSGWEATIGESRRRWHTRQLKAAVRRDPESAAESLREAGYMILPP